MIRIRICRSRSKWGCMSPHFKSDNFNRASKLGSCVSSNLPLPIMFTDSSTILQVHVDSTGTDHEHCMMQNELDPLIQRDEKGPTKKEERVARAQFLALCWALFVVGWTDGSTGPLLPRIQISYDVSSVSLTIPLTSHEFCRWGSEQCLGFLFCNAQLVMFVRVHVVTLMPFQGSIVGALLNMPLTDRLGLGKVSF